jgi:hypothetical protein
MYTRWLPNCEIAARQRWGVPGAFYPETAPFNGPKVLPEDVAKEFQDVMRGRKPAWELSERAIAECSYDSQLHVTAATRERGKDHYQLGRYTWISHYATGNLDIGLQFWWRFRYTGDREWLRTRTYPILRGGMEFYRGLAGEKGADGKYHIYPTNARERFWGVRDSITDLAVLRGAGPIAIRAAELLGVDADLRAKWKEFLDHLAPYPMGSEPEAKALTGGVLKDDTWAAGRLGDVKGSRNGEIVWESPVFPYEHVTLATKDVDPALWEVAWRTCQAVPAVTWGSWSRTMLNIARMGDRQRLPEALIGHYLADGINRYPNMYPGNDASPAIPAAFQDAMLQGVSPRPGEPEVLMIYPCWPEGWNGSFRLLARGGFLVGSTIRDGKVGFVEIESRLGETCRLRNPWNGAALTIESGGTKRAASGAIVEIATHKGSRHLIYPAASPRPAPESIHPPPQTEPTVLRWPRPGKPDQVALLGKPRPNMKTLPRSLAGKDASLQGTVPRDGLRLWLRSDRGVKADGGRVEVWEDQSGNGFHARASGAQRPVLAAGPAGPLRRGRYIRLQHPTDRVIVAEVQVYSRGTNIARGKRAAQQGQWGDCPAGNAVDGDTSGEMTPKDGRRNSVACTDVGGWWEVDLGKTVDIDKLVIWNLSDSNAKRQVGLRVSVLDENRKAVNEYDIDRHQASWTFDAGRASTADEIRGHHSGLPAIRFDGRSQYLQATNGLGMNLPGPLTLVVVATVKDRWPRAIFSPVPDGNQNDFESPGSFAFHCAHGSGGNGAFGLVQGLGRDHLGLTAPCNQPGRAETVVVVRPTAPGETAGIYLDGELMDIDAASSATPPVRQSRGYVIGSRWPINGQFFGRNDVYEILVYDRVLSDAELQSLHQYLRVPRTP